MGYTIIVILTINMEIIMSQPKNILSRLKQPINWKKKKHITIQSEKDIELAIKLGLLTPKSSKWKRQ